jgi:hypothetical protein
VFTLDLMGRLIFKLNSNLKKENIFISIPEIGAVYYYPDV